MRWLSPIKYKKLAESLKQCKNILIVDECRKTGCHGEGILVELLSIVKGKPKIRLHAAEDSFIPLGAAATSTLPSKNSIIEKSIELINE